jgi:hypothetical protein
MMAVVKSGTVLALRCRNALLTRSRSFYEATAAGTAARSCGLSTFSHPRAVFRSGASSPGEEVSEPAPSKPVLKTPLGDIGKDLCGLTGECRNIPVNATVTYCHVRQLGVS